MIKGFVFDAYGTLYDVQSVAAEVEAAFPGRGDYITQVWRLKQLEYSWLRSMCGLYAGFRTVTRESLAYTLRTLGHETKPEVVENLSEAYDRLTPYPDAAAALRSLTHYRLAILSNGSPDMLSALVRNSALNGAFEAILSVDAVRAYKPDPRAYEPVRTQLGLQFEEVVFVSSNGFDVAGAKNVGFRVARIERVPSASLHGKIAASESIGPKLMFDALRSQIETFGAEPDVVIGSLGELPGVVDKLSG